MPIILLRPSDIRFAQNSISGEFQDGTRLDETFVELLRETLTPDRLPPIDVVYKADQWWTVTGNRRLYLYRKLEALHLVNRIKVNQRSMDEYWVRKQLRNLMTTENSGKSVYIRRSYSHIAVEIDRLEREWTGSRSKETVVNAYDTRNTSQAIPNVVRHTRTSNQANPNVVTYTSTFSESIPSIVGNTRTSNQAIPNVASHTRTSSQANPNVVTYTRTFSESIPNVVGHTCTGTSNQAIPNVVTYTSTFSETIPNVVGHTIYRTSNQANPNEVSHTFSQVDPSLVSHTRDYISSNSSQSVGRGMSHIGYHDSGNTNHSGERATRNSSDSLSLADDTLRGVPAVSVVDIEIESSDAIQTEPGYLASLYNSVLLFIARLFRLEAHVS